MPHIEKLTVLAGRIKGIAIGPSPATTNRKTLTFVAEAHLPEARPRVSDARAPLLASNNGFLAGIEPLRYSRFRSSARLERHARLVGDLFAPELGGGFGSIQFLVS